MNPSDEQKLATLIHRTLRDLPPRPAPHTLEARVQAELDRRAALPWWRQSYAYWPLAARCGFLAVSGGAARLVLMAGIRAVAGFDAAPLSETIVSRYAAVEAVATTATSLAHIAENLFHAIPPLWLYSGLGFLAIAYAMLFGLSAVAYRTICANR